MSRGKWILKTRRPHFCDTPMKPHWPRKPKSLGSQWQCKCGKTWRVVRNYTYNYGWEQIN